MIEPRKTAVAAATTTYLLLAALLLFSAPKGCVAARVGDASPRDAVQEPGPTTTTTTTTAERTARSSLPDLYACLNRLLPTAMSLPTSVLTAALRSVQAIASTIETTARQLLDLTAAGNGRDVGQGGLFFTAGTGKGPFGFARRASDSPGESVASSIPANLTDGIRAAVNYLNTTGLPWLRDGLSRFENSLPDSRDVIQTVSEILRGLGLAGAASA